MSHPLLAIAAGGAAGAVARYLVSVGVTSLAGRGFPYGTLTVNVSGSLLIGLLYVTMIERSLLSPEWRAALQIGFLGAFTTFSTFSLETVELLSRGETLRAGVNVLLSVFLCIVATGVGMTIGRQI